MKKNFFSPHVIAVDKCAAGIAMTLLLLGLCTCQPGQVPESEDYRAATRIAHEWNRFALELERYTPGYRPPVSGRMFAYVEMAAYEAALPALSGYVSMESYCPGYTKTNADTVTEAFYLPASLNAAYAQILRSFFPTAPPYLLAKINQIEIEQAHSLSKKIDTEVFKQSAVFGKRTATAVWHWSASDDLGHDGFLYNYDRNYVPPTCVGCWQPSGEHPMPALLPHWGEARPFVVNLPEMVAKTPIVYDESPSSAFYTEALEVFSVSQPLSKENLWIAEFWSDDLPGLTCTPAGRWISITRQALESAQSPFPQVIETYLKAGLALCDGGIVCWQNKYRYHMERPNVYIVHNIEPTWTPLHESPSFPAYPSGHAIFGAAVAEVLSTQLGDAFKMTDHSHEGRREFASAPRTFNSFEEMARENAFSRIAIGVHYRMDCEEGLRLGKLIGQQVSHLSLRREEIVLAR